jgi:WD40 repeat protein
MDGTQLDSVASVSNSSTYSAPSISPDGATAVVENNGSVKLIDVASKTVRTLTTPCGEPRYSPDGTRFACLKNGVVSVMNVDGTSLRTLASQLEDISGVDWSPDGAWLIGRGLSNPVLVNANDGMTISLSQIATYQQLSFVR